MINLKWLLSEQRQYMDGDLPTYGNISVPFAIVLGEPHAPEIRDPHGLERIMDARRLENNVIAKMLPEYILAEPGIGAWIFDPIKNEARLREDEPLDCSVDKEDMELFLKLDINYKEREKHEAFQSFLDYDDNNVNPDLVDLQLKLWPIKYKIPLVGCDLGLHENAGFLNPSNEAREEKMGQIISHYAKKSLKPIIAIIGRNHTGSTYRIQLILRQENVGYLILRY